MQPGLFIQVPSGPMQGGSALVVPHQLSSRLLVTPLSARFSVTAYAQPITTTTLQSELRNQTQGPVTTVGKVRVNRF